MIELNLLPEELRIKEESGGQKIPVIPLAIGAGALFIGITFIFYFNYLGAKASLAKLNTQWQQVQPQSIQLNDLETEVEVRLKPEKQFLETFVTTERPLTWLLETASRYLPASAWLTELKSEHDAGKSFFVVKGLCFSTEDGSSIQHIESYVHDLKKEMPETRLSLTTSRTILEGVELTHFTAMFTWKKMEDNAAA